MAKKYKTHNELKITFAEYSALFGVQAMLKAGVLKHTANAFNVVPGKHLFNMAQWRKEAHCGSVQCIGGSMEAMLGRGVISTRGLSDLFNVHSATISGSAMYRITPAHAVKAIENYLRTGKAHWNKVLPASLKA